VVAHARSYKMTHVKPPSRGRRPALVVALLFALAGISESSRVPPQGSIASTPSTPLRTDGRRHSPGPPAPHAASGALSTRAGGTVHLHIHSAIFYGMLLSFNSGFVNGACLSGLLSSDGTKQAAAAVTGAWTNGALGAAAGQWGQFAFNAKCIGSYAGGSLISGLLSPRPEPFAAGPGVARAFGIGAALLFASAHLSAKGASATAFLYPAAAACGIQNGVTSALSSNLLRTSHFSGITSDVGTFLGQMLRGNNANKMKMKTFVCLALSFWSGGAVSYHMASKFLGSSLLFSAGLYLLISLGLLMNGDKSEQ